MRHRKTRVIEVANAILMADIAEAQALMRYGWSAEKLALKAQRELRALGEARHEAEAKDGITDECSDGRQVRPVTGLMRAGVARIRAQAASWQVVEMAA